MRSFLSLGEAWRWLCDVRAHPCTVIVHGDPYWYHAGRLIRMYPGEFYLKARAA